MATAYEQSRKQQIAQNQDVLRSLGLAAPPDAERPARRSRRPRAIASACTRSSARVAAHDSGHFARMHLFGRSIDDWPLQLPPAYSKVARARRQAAATLELGGGDAPRASDLPNPASVPTARVGSHITAERS
jgi:hypothetical protein